MSTVTGVTVVAPVNTITINDVDGPADAIIGNNNDLSNRSLHKCTINNCDKEFKVKAHLARHYAQAHGIAIRSGSPRPIMKTRTAFYLHTTGATKVSRRLCRHIIRSKKAARQPSYAINLQAVKLECKWMAIFRIRQNETNFRFLLISQLLVASLENRKRTSTNCLFIRRRIAAVSRTLLTVWEIRNQLRAIGWC